MLEERAGQARFLKAMQLPLTWQSSISKHPKNASSLQNTIKQTMKSRCRRTESPKAQTPAITGYLQWTTFHKGHLTEPEGSGGLCLCRAGGHLPDWAARGVGGRGKWRGKEVEEEELAGWKAQCLRPTGLCQGPLKSWEVQYLRKSRAQWRVKERVEWFSSFEEGTTGCTYPLILMLNQDVAK